MILNWFLELSATQSLIFIIFISISFSCGGLLIFNQVSKKMFGTVHENNETISYYLATIGVFYGITLGLITVGSWEKFRDIEEKINDEAAIIASIYRTSSRLPEPTNKKLCAEIKDYTNYVIYIAWPQHQKGIIPMLGNQKMFEFENELYSFKPKTEVELEMWTEIMNEYNELIKLRRKRLNTVNSNLPLMLWLILIFGAILTVTISWLFVFKNFSLHIVLNALLGIFIGGMIFVVAMLDDPYRGEVSISPKPFEKVFEQMVK